jgi:inosine-uridine nucleoside N-ribohydrolase
MSEPPPVNRRRFLKQTIAVAGAAGMQGLGLSLAQRALAQEKPSSARRIPVILATDIGDDIDDTWALGLALKSPELDLKLVVGEYGKAEYRAKLIAKFLETVGRSDIPVGVGMDGEPHGVGNQAAWVKDYDLNSYPGKVRRDGVQAIIDTIHQSGEGVTVVCIAPMPNLAAALGRDPQIARLARFVGMQGSLRVGYGGSKTVSAEWNVKADPKACQAAFAAPWDKTITPLDTCGLVNLDGERYQRMRDSKDVIAATVIENYRIWSKAGNSGSDAAEHHSSTLFDTVAVYLAVSQDFCQMERLGVRVTDDGFTVIDPQGNMVNAATAWKNEDGFRDFLTTRLTGAKG